MVHQYDRINDLKEKINKSYMYQEAFKDPNPKCYFSYPLFSSAVALSKVDSAYNHLLTIRAYASQSIS